MALEIALVIPAGNSRVPEGILDLLTEGKAVGPPYSMKQRKLQCPDRRHDTGELYLSQTSEWAAAASYSEKGRGAWDDRQAKLAIYAQASVPSAERDRAGIRLIDR